MVARWRLRLGASRPPLRDLNGGQGGGGRQGGAKGTSGGARPRPAAAAAARPARPAPARGTTAAPDAPHGQQVAGGDETLPERRCASGERRLPAGCGEVGARGAAAGGACARGAPYERHASPKHPEGPEGGCGGEPSHAEEAAEEDPLLAAGLAQGPSPEVDPYESDPDDPGCTWEGDEEWPVIDTLTAAAARAQACGGRDDEDDGARAYEEEESPPPELDDGFEDVLLLLGGPSGGPGGGSQGGSGRDSGAGAHCHGAAELAAALGGDAAVAPFAASQPAGEAGEGGGAAPSAAALDNEEVPGFQLSPLSPAAPQSQAEWEDPWLSDLPEDGLLDEASPPPPSSLTRAASLATVGVSDVSDAEVADVASDAKEADSEVDETLSDEVVALLLSLGLEQHVPAFVREEICMLSLPLLSDADLTALGVIAPGVRAVLGAAIRERAKATGVVMPTAHLAALPAAPEDAAARRARITDFFGGPKRRAGANAGDGGALTRKRLRTEHITAYFSTSSGKTLPPPRAAGCAGTSRGRGGSKADKADRGRGFSGEPPPWVRVPGTKIIVDGFRYRSAPCDNYVLTHFHSDHYVGLTKHMKWNPDALVWCTPTTARLVCERIGTPVARLRVLQVGQTALVEGHRMTFLDANHCPGACMVHLVPRGGDGNAVLHTGDCRYNAAAMPAAMWAALAPVRTLILDTTYCAPQYTFPPQAEVIDFVERAMRAEAFNKNVLFLIGSYSIGKERLYFEVARRLKKKLYVSATKLKTLKLLDLPAWCQQMLTTNDQETSIQVVPMGKLTLKNMRLIAKHYRMQYKVVVGFAPTGWSHGKTTKGIGRKASWSKGTLVKYEVPYSEHSSFAELQQMVNVIKPARILPHVFGGGGGSAEQMVEALTS